MSKNNITGDRLVSKPIDGYQEGYDRIWKKEDVVLHFKPEEDKKDGRCTIHDNEKVEND